ncbi:hypothetical protein D6D01_01240 [Aureobasidium pullulans]|uniref:DUF7907 domain-containing protein n=1 Tax=Aureobasidium pullulans TaxID=5580 RepID=A0A4S9LZN8_AURPU|nr:hypothetical protein D6D01_01240 [Aureobasidium pullulans]
MYTSIKTLAAAIALPLVAALPLSQRTEAVFDSTKPFTLHTEVVNGTGAFNGQYLSSFHVGAGQSTIVGSKNSSIAVGWTLSDSILQQPLAISGAPAGFAYNLSLLEQAPFRSDAPIGYDYVDLSASGKATTGFYFNNATLAWSASNSTSAPDSFDGCFALCHVNGTSPYFSLGSQYQLLWKMSNATSTSSNCADVKLIGANIAA